MRLRTLAFVSLMAGAMPCMADTFVRVTVEIGEQEYTVDCTTEDLMRFTKFAKLTTVQSFGAKRGIERTRQLEKLLVRRQKDFITRALLVQDATIAKVTVTDDEVETQREKMAARLLGLGPLDELRQEVGLSEDEFVRVLREQAMIEKRINDAIREDIKVTDEELKAEIDRLRDDVMRKESVRIQYVLCRIEDQGDQDSVREARQRAKSLKNKVEESGVPFEALLSESDDPKSTDPEQPNLFFRGMGMLEQMFGDEVEVGTFELENGQTSAPLRGDAGFYLVHILRHDRPRVPSDDVLELQAGRGLEMSKRLQAVANYRNSLNLTAKLEFPKGSSKPQ